MEYIWYTILQRKDDFYEITPKYFFKQWTAHKKFNGLTKGDKKEQEQILTTNFG